MVAKRFPDTASMVPPADGVMELSLLVSQSQFEALEQAARRVNLSMAQYLRRLVQWSTEPEPASESV